MQSVFLSSLDILLHTQLTDRTAKPVIDLVVDELLSYHSSPPPNSATPQTTGYVMAAGGRYAKYGYATCRFIREVLKDSTPIEVWVGSDETLENWGIPDCLHRQSTETKGGWPLKADAVFNSCFRHIVFLDSDCIPLVPAADLTSIPEYQETGAVFFPDICNHRRSDWAFPALGLKINSVSEMEAGQLIIDRARHLLAIELVCYFNHHPEFFYRHNHGDKDLWALAFARLGIPFTTSVPCENKEWGLRHFLPDCSPGFDHLIHTKSGRRYDGEHAEKLTGYLEEYSAP
jgi:hypothetical protein